MMKKIPKSIAIIFLIFISHREQPCHAFHHTLPSIGHRSIHPLQISFAVSLDEHGVERYSVLPEYNKPKRVKKNKQSFRQTKVTKNNTNHNNNENVSKNHNPMINKLPKGKKLSDIIKSENKKKDEVEIEKIEKTISKSEPWNANYLMSSATQRKIRDASTIKGNGIERGINILKTVLHNTPSHWCNEANIVYALTLSAKCLAGNKKKLYSQTNREEFRSLLYQTLDILHEMVKNKKLNMRQLANASWAIAKHYVLDPMILPNLISNQSVMYSRTGSIGSTVSSSEQWNLEEEEEDATTSREKRLLSTLDIMTKSLIDSISTSFEETDGRGRHRGLKIAELSMSCWAFSTLFPRTCPAGWKLPSLMGQMNGDTITNSDTVLFEKWEIPNEDYQTNDDKPKSLIDEFFDVVAKRLIFQNSEYSTLIGQMRWNELSTISWAYAHRGFCMSTSSVALMSQLANEAMKRIKNIHANADDRPTPRDVSEIAWALGVSQTDNHVLDDVLDEYISILSSTYLKLDQIRPLKDWSPADCVQLAVAMAHGRLDDQELLKTIYYEATNSLKDEIDTSSTSMRSNKHFHSWELSVLLWVQARLYLTKDIGLEFDEYSNILPKVILSRLNAVSCNSADYDSHSYINKKFTGIGLSSQEKANICWSLTVLDKIKTSEAKQLVKEIFRDVALSCSCGDKIRLEHAHQLWQSMFLLDFPLDDVVTEEFISFLRQTWDEEKARSKASSARHKALSQTLDFMGVSHYNEHDEDIDVAIVLKSGSKWLHSASKCDVSESKTRVAVE